MKVSIPSQIFQESLSLVNSPVNCFESLLSSYLSCDNSWYDDSASDSLRVRSDPLENHFQSPRGFDDSLLHGRDTVNCVGQRFSESYCL